MLTIKDYLSQAFTLDKLIRAREAQIQELRDKLCFVGSVSDGIKVQTSIKLDRMSEAVVRLMDMIAEYERDVLRLLTIKSEIKTYIDGVVNPVHQLILTERYINLKRWEDIASDNNYSWNYLIYRLHPRALNDMKKQKI